MKFSTFLKQAELIQARLKTIKENVVRIEKETLITPQHIEKIKLLDASVIIKNNEFEKLVSKLFSTSSLPEELDESENISKISMLQDEIGDLYMSIHSSCIVLNPPSDQNDVLSIDQTVSNQQTTPRLSVQLPRIQLGTFSGETEKWMSFRNLFENTIHKNENISSVEKMSYLLSCLEGEALSVVKSLPITDSNYFIAWEALNKRFHNSRLLISIHVNNLLDLQNMFRPSLKQLRQFLSVLNENVEALKALNQDVSQESLIFTSHLLRKFDSDFRRLFEQSRTDNTIPPKIEELITYVESHCKQLEAANLTNVGTPQKFTSSSSSNFSNSKNSSLTKVAYKQRTNKTALLVSTRVLCSYCSSTEHSIYQCEDFLNLTVQERFNAAKHRDLCKNCLGDKHKVFECKSQRTCSVCKKKHHTLLHFVETSLRNTNPQKVYPSATQSSNLTPVHSTQEDNKFVGLSNSENTVLLATVLIVVTSNTGKRIVCRGVLDSAAQSTFITQKCAQNLGLQRTSSHDLYINGISSSQVQTKGFSYVTLSALSGHVLANSHPVFILDKITDNLPKAKITPEVRSRMQHLVLADPTFDTPAPIDVLIGADLFATSVKGQFLSLGENMPVAIETVFGYALLGSTPTFNKVDACRPNGVVTLLTTSGLDLHASIQKFWTLEEPPYVSKRSLADEECEKHFMATHSRNSDGRYVVSLPFSDEPSKLGDSSKVAKGLFLSLENKFLSNSKLKTEYVDFMKDYLLSGHMSLCSTALLEKCEAQPHYYLPHHGVFKDNKLRVVFNASAPTSTSVSLNSLLYQGEKLHNDICDIILNFRRHAYVFTCDIRQMFRQILINEADQIYQLIYWRENENLPLQVYKLTTVTYGVASSPFLANRVVQQLLLDESKNYQLAASELKDQIYVDDALLGSDSLDKALALKKDVIKLLSKGGFELRKWSTNHPLLLESVPEDHKDKPLGFRAPEQPLHSVLGLKWIPNEDIFSYTVGLKKLNETPTKRLVLSSIAQIYDPSGWLTPLTFWSKMFMQHLWALGLNWDDPLNSDLSSSWKKFVNEVSYLEQLKIPRYIGLSSAKNIQLHAFSDASESGYAGCVYLRVEDEDRNVSTHLLIAKSRVAPLKRISLPRLELCGAHLVSKLLKYCINRLSRFYKIDSYQAWCDSTIVLSWIHMPSYRLKVYISNRVSEIQENVPPVYWSHISSAENPADCGSRGLSPQALINHPLWWNGPKWLSLPEINWAKQVHNSLPENLVPETKPLTLNTLAVIEKPQFSLTARYSSWTTLLHVTAYILRFINNTRNKSKLSGGLKLNEIKSANNVVCKLIQQEHFSDEISCLKNKKPCSMRIRRLSPYLDENGLVRVGGRLKNSDLSAENKHPILLPKDNHAVNVLVDHYHVIYLHSGPTLTQAMLVDKYWILSARSKIRSRIFKCIRCFRCKPPSTAPVMGDLPKSRVTPSRPFSISGVDYAGHFFVKQHMLRKVQPMKVYICIFICFCTKAIHIEVVTDLTTDCYIAALTRFVSRRGLVSDIHSDNGTNFKGASEKLRRQFDLLMKDPKTQAYAEQSNIKFHFIPPSAPHQGGLWERAVRSIKHHLTRVVGQQILTLEEFITLTTRIEAMMNSRPLTPLSADPTDLEALTPGHFLVGGPLLAPVEPNFNNIPLNRLSRWQMVQNYFQNIWDRWRKEYLQTLQPRIKWNTPKRNIVINDLVVVHDENAPPLSWKLGRVVSVMPGSDKVVRVVKLKTASGYLTRPVIKVSVLPLDE